MKFKNWIEYADKPLSPKATPSAFANWVYKASNNNYIYEIENDARTDIIMQQGKMDHDAISRFMMFKWTQKFLGINEKTLHDWKLTFVDDKSLQSQPITYTSNLLTVNGKPLKCIPDAVLRNDKKELVLIIERKTTRVPEPYIPKNGWPNVEAQLWCYSWIDDFVDARNVILVGQLWHRKKWNNSISLCHNHSSWHRNCEKHHTRCLSWFNKYGGVFHGYEG